MKRITAIAWAFLAALPLLVDWTWKAWIHRRPFWIFYYDPETIYFYEGLRILGGHAPHNVDNPGTTLQLLTAAIASLTGSSPLRFDAFRLPAYTIALLLSLGAIFLLRRTLFRKADPRWLVAGVWTFFLAPSALEYSAVWAAEIVYFPLAVLALAAVWRIDERASTAALAGAAIGLGLATKFLFVPWLVALIVMLVVARRWRHLVAAIGGAAAAFLAFTAVAAPRYRYMLGWLWQLATHSRSYGYGPKQAPELSSVIRDGASMALQAWPWIAWLALIVGTLIVRRTRMEGRILFAVTAMSLGVLLAVRVPGADFKYLLPVSAASIALVATMERPPFAAFAIAGVLVATSVGIDLWHHERKISEELQLRGDLDAAVHDFAPHGVVVYSGRVPEPAFALRLETIDPAYLSQISAAYPSVGHYPQWEGRVFLPDGATHWDLLVLHDSLLRRFPEPMGRTVRVIPPYRVIMRPGT